jgi:4,5-DOPA dioxygenase extradiol
LLLIGSGSATHNLEEFYYGGHAPDQPPLNWVSEFTDWVHDKVTAGKVDELLRYRTLAPHAADNHPTEEHILPLFIAFGAGEGAGKRIHSSVRSGVISMDTYAFN